MLKMASYDDYSDTDNLPSESIFQTYETQPQIAITSSALKSNARYSNNSRQLKQKTLKVDHPIGRQVY